MDEKDANENFSLVLFQDVRFMEERSLVGVLKIAKSKVAPTESETSETIYRREQASRLADCILQTYKHYREESDKLIKDADFLQEIKEV